ncbi:MAG: iron transporter [Mogibacterium sp.]|nr:iron transporter [Mogibacterium sp.]
MIKHKLSRILICAVLTAVMLIMMTGCGGTETTADPGIADGTYVASFTTDNSMFHVNEANQDKGILTVKDGKMTIHVSLQSKKIINLYPGLAEDAKKDGAELLEPTTDKVVYSDGYEDEVYGFDIPVPALDEEFDVALIGTHGNWYDHKVVVSDPVEGDDIQAVIGGSASGESGTATDLADGEHTIEVALEGGTGRASVESPAVIRKNGDDIIAVITWSSPYYDYMIVDGQRYEPVNTEGNSVFEIPVASFDSPLDVIADTTAMSEPHEIEYTLKFDLSSMK